VFNPYDKLQLIKAPQQVISSRPTSKVGRIFHGRPTLHMNLPGATPTSLGEITLQTA